jgi:hypothetical protein
MRSKFSNEPAPLIPSACGRFREFAKRSWSFLLRRTFIPSLQRARISGKLNSFSKRMKDTQSKGDQSAPRRFQARSFATIAPDITPHTNIY